MKMLYLYLATVPVFFAIDIAWIGLVANRFYQAQIGQFLKASPNWPAAIVFYLLYIAGILVFAVLPHYGAGVGQVALYGALFGLIAYATYDLTLYSTMKDWPLALTLVDLAWGTTLTASVAAVSAVFAKWIL